MCGTAAAEGGGAVPHVPQGLGVVRCVYVGKGVWEEAPVRTQKRALLLSDQRLRQSRRLSST